MTYFFNGGVEAPWPGRGAAARAVAQGGHLRPAAGDERRRRDRASSSRRSARGRYDFIVANFANPDMVGHTGVWDATVDGARRDRRLPGRGSPTRSPPWTLPTRTGPGAVLFVTADHGNADEMIDDAGSPVTTHSLNPVPLLGVGRALAGRTPAGRRPRGRRADHPRARRPAPLGRG